MIVSDLSHIFGADLRAAPGGDLATASSTERGQQRVLRRLLTNPGDYLFHPDYGAGLPQWVGRTARIPELKALVLGQMLLEPSVSASPPPVIDIAPIPNTAGGGFAIAIRYTDAPSGETVTLSFDVTR
jgi:hypothetical protein